MTEITASRIALLELEDEQKLALEGYTLLDEKRILLASEIKQQLIQHAELVRECTKLENQVLSRSVAAVSRHGIDELSVYSPPLSIAADRLVIRQSRLLGLELAAIRLEKSVQPQPPPAEPFNATPEVFACAVAHQTWLDRAVEIAACRVNLRRLAQDYVRTERRAKPLRMC